MSKTFREDLTGQRFGRLTVLEFVPNDKPHSYWKCQCDCGNIKVVQGTFLKSTKTSSCGCFQKEVAKQIGLRKITHGGNGTRLYRIWWNIKSRCNNPNDIGYKNYGARGIKVCTEWEKDFAVFKDWAIENGYTDELTIDRINVDGNYEPSNCRWATKIEQNRNKKNSIFVIYCGKRINLGEAAELSGINYDILKARYKNGDRGNRLFRPKEK